MINKYVLIIIGAGGTGTYFLKEFSRFIAGTEYEKKFAAMYIMDGDTVERKNLSRQCFCEEDIGRNKASVMAEILNDTFHLSFVSMNQYLNTVDKLKELCNNHKEYNRRIIPVIISCVDNHGCRLLLEEFYQTADDCVYFDSANEYDTGEVIYSYRFNKNEVGPVRSVYFPDIKYKDIRNREEMSCEELNNVAPQHIFTNMKAANLLLTGVANLMEDIVTPGFAYFNALKYEATFFPFKAGEKDA